MKKIVILLVLLLVTTNNSNSVDSSQKIFKNSINLTSKLKYPLPKGNWIKIHEDNDNWDCNIQTKFVLLGKVNDNKIVEAIKFEIINSAIKCTWILDYYIEDWVFNPDPEIDNCYDKGNYFNINVIKKGWAHNCFITTHIDPTTPKKDWEAEDFRLIAKLKEKYKFSPIYLNSRHYFYSRTTIQKWFGIEYFVSPEVLNGPSSKPGDKQSEYHIFNINNHPSHLIAMNKWLETAKKRHIQLEKFVNAKDDFRLDLSLIKKNKDINNNFVSELEKINKLFKSGALTKDEFIKAKKKLLKNND